MTLARPDSRAALLAPTALGVVAFACDGLLPAVPNPSGALLVGWIMLTLAAEAFIGALYSSAEWSPPRPGVFRASGRNDVWSGEICGTVEAAEEPFRGPDGRPCVAALHGRHSRWTPLWVVAGRDRILVKVAVDTLRCMRWESWRYEVVRPRWFGGGAFAPELAPGERLDWVCIRVGDFVRISCVGMNWAGGVEPSTDDVAETEAAPYRVEGRDLEVELDLRKSEDDYAAVEIAHPTMGHAWWRRRVLRTATIAAATLLGITSWVWADYASSSLGWSHALPLVLLLVGAAMFVVPLAAWISLGLVHAWSSDSPPPWIPGGKAEALVDSASQSWVELAYRLRVLIFGSATLVITSISTAFLGFTGLVVGSGVIAIAAFLYALLGSRRQG
jgi:hypothetical protein